MDLLLERKGAHPLIHHQQDSRRTRTVSDDVTDATSRMWCVLYQCGQGSNFPRRRFRGPWPFCVIDPPVNSWAWYTKTMQWSNELSQAAASSCQKLIYKPNPSWLLSFGHTSSVHVHVLAACLFDFGHAWTWNLNCRIVFEYNHKCYNACFMLKCMCTSSHRTLFGMLA